LYLADRRWGSGGALNYEQEADSISHAMIANPAQDGNTPLFNAGANLLVFQHGESIYRSELQPAGVL
jgi:hypothetical protein